MKIRVTRRRFLAASAIGIGLLGADAAWLEPYYRVSITHHTLGEPEGGPALRMLQLSDLHLQKIGSHEQRVAEAVHDLAPDLILITGDVIDRPDRLEILDRFMQLLPASVPAIATLGNWEHWARVDLAQLRNVYESRSVKLLVNESMELHHQGFRVLVTGMDDSTAGRPDLAQALRAVSPTRNHVILAHSPTYRDALLADARPLQVADRLLREGVDLPQYAPELMLSGHTHGGQVQLLGWAPLRPPGSGRYVAGWYRDTRPHLYVSRGIGTSVLPIRFGAPPEIAVFNWHLRA